jgi:hypothetical protein
MKRIDAARVVELARGQGTPFYVYDADVIRERVASLRAFDVIRYAQKACSNVHILRLLRTEGCLVDAVSLGEIERAVRAGFDGVGDPAGLVYTADVLDEATLARVIDLDVPVNAGSVDMLEQLGRRRPGHRVWIRGSRTQPQDEHGRRVEQARRLARVPRRGPAPGREVPPRSGRSAHAHRLRERLRPPAAGVRRHGGPGPRAGCGRARPVRRWGAADPLQVTGRAHRHRRPARALGSSATRSRWRSSRAATW